MNRSASKKFEHWNSWGRDEKRTRVFLIGYFGFGNNRYTSRIFYQGNREIPDKIYGSANYILLGKIIPFSTWSISSQARINNKLTQFSLSLLKSFN